MLLFLEHFNSVEGIIALITLGIIFVQLILTLIVGADTDLDLDADGVDFDISSIVSPKGILHFLAGYSWYLVLVDIMRGEKLWWDWFVGAGVGLVVSIAVLLIYWGMSKLACEHKIEQGEDLVGRSGAVYISIENKTTISININGALRELDVISKSGKVFSIGDIVTVIEFKDGIYYVA